MCWCQVQKHMEHDYSKHNNSDDACLIMKLVIINAFECKILMVHDTTDMKFIKITVKKTLETSATMLFFQQVVTEWCKQKSTK